MPHESPKAEMLRLRHEQSEARQHEVFGGLTSDERAAYDIRQTRLHELEQQLFDPKRPLDA